MAWRTPRDAEIPIAARVGVERRAPAALRHAWACVWWSVRAHVADVHQLPRAEALEPPPARWLEGRPEPREARTRR